LNESSQLAPVMVSNFEYLVAKTVGERVDRIAPTLRMSDEEGISEY
jgi:hypothetical protein